MKQSKEKSYECEVCGRTGTEHEILAHEESCCQQRKKREEYLDKIQRKVKERRDKAVEWASTSDPVLLLVKHGFMDEGKTLCIQWAKWNLWDCGTSSGWEEVYNVMMDAAVDACAGSDT